MAGLPKTRTMLRALADAQLCMTTAGANAYVKKNPNFLKGYASEAIKMYKKEELRRDATTIFAVIGTVATRADDSVFEEYISSEDYVPFVAHVRDVLTAAAKSHRWLETGILEDCDGIIFSATTNLLKTPAFNAVLLCTKNPAKESAFSVMAKLCEAHGMADESQAMDLVQIVWGAVKYGRIGWVNDGTGAKHDDAYIMLRHLESCGVLAHALAAMTVPADEPVAVEDAPHQQTSLALLQRIENEPRILRKKFCSGTKSGNILDVIVDLGQAGPDSDKPIMSALKRIHQLARETSSSSIPFVKTTLCYNCHSIPEKELYCGRCRITTYCSKECQTAHWKAHKPLCNNGWFGNKFQRNENANNAACTNFVSTNYGSIMVEMAAFTQKHGGIKMKDVILEVDLMDPAKRGTFKLDKATRYLEGKRSAKPKWKSVNMDAILNEVQRSKAAFPDAMLAIFRCPTGGVTIMMPPMLWSDEALAQFPHQDATMVEMQKKVFDSTIGLLSGIKRGGR